jgi:hypothetical protein
MCIQRGAERIRISRGTFITKNVQILLIRCILWFEESLSMSSLRQIPQVIVLEYIARTGKDAHAADVFLERDSESIRQRSL